MHLLLKRQVKMKSIDLFSLQTTTANMMTFMITQILRPNNSFKRTP